jgi:phospholipid/cholesterol/gamma-HCH transport system substrate-binding protein
METRANYAVIGAFVIVATLAVAAFVLWLGQSQFQRDYKAYDIVFEGPVSLEDGSAVRYIGIKVGEFQPSVSTALTPPKSVPASGSTGRLR